MKTTVARIALVLSLGLLSSGGTGCMMVIGGESTGSHNAGQWTDGIQHNPTGASVQCLGHMKSGERCKYNTTNVSGYCYLHQ